MDDFIGTFDLNFYTNIDMDNVINYLLEGETSGNISPIIITHPRLTKQSCFRLQKCGYNFYVFGFLLL